MLRQTSLKSFLGIISYPIPSYFTLELVEANLTQKPPSRSHLFDFKASLKSGSNQIFIFANKSASYIYPIQQFSNDSAIPFLKSMLQKCIRRGNVQVAISTAFNLLFLDPLTLVRRLTIIMIEDSMLNINIETLIWYTCALSKGYRLNLFDVENILGFVSFAASCPIKLEFTSTDFVDLETEKVSSLDHSQKNFLYSLGIRRGFGGSKFDLDLVNSAIHFYLEIFHNDVPLNKWFKQRIIAVDVVSIVTLIESNWVLDGMDFHISRVLDLWLRALDEDDLKKGVDVDYLKNVMWSCGSGVSTKTLEDGQVEFDDPKYRHFWNKYKGRLDIIRRNLIRQKL